MIKLLGILLLIPMTTLLAEPQDVVSKKVKSSTTLRVNPLIYDRTVQGGMDEVYKKVFTALENNSYYVLFEPNIGKNLSHFAKRWGDDYNKNKLTSIRSMVFCSGWYANKISNLDPGMLALCPLRITLYSKNKETHILFVRPGKVAGPSKAQKVAKELEDDVIRTIEVAISSL
ncbi:MAG: DUF302 domain-containing protein [Gammaproteobacteria bacterium]|nr:DUF302 domain-containing protein [Gammaproteobacteria bacterium]